MKKEFRSSGVTGVQEAEEAGRAKNTARPASE
jgi:hypothetical protein